MRLGEVKKNDAREIATMLYDEVDSSGQFRFVNFGHPPPLVFSGENQKFTQVNQSRHEREQRLLGIVLPPRLFFALNLVGVRVRPNRSEGIDSL
jgi:hypothetical protein